jgi:hypothetical protein
MTTMTLIWRTRKWTRVVTNVTRLVTLGGISILDLAPAPRAPTGRARPVAKKQYIELEDSDSDFQI